MLKINQLRFGNWVYSKATQKNVRVRSLTSGVVNNSPLDNFDPVRLTPEILEWVQGYDKKENIIVYSKDGKPYHDYDFAYIDGLLYFGWHKAEGFCIETQKPLEYVHQLQNLFHCLAGVELNITL